MSDKIITTKYTNDVVTVVWQPSKCIHSAVCARGLPIVFRPSERPWIVMDEASTEAIVEQVKKCPSGALSYYMNDALQSVPSAEEENE
jgi:uncharacterized Fe-S cluster protein YjdI